jgi:hypothetical protein
MWGYKQYRQTRLVVVNNLVQLEAHSADLVELVRILDIVADLVIEDTRGLDYSVGLMVLVG